LGGLAEWTGYDQGQELVATAALRTSWVVIPCADKGEAADLERKST
jgi:hypothetical protein